MRAAATVPDNSNQFRDILTRAREQGRTSLPAADARTLCLAYGIPMPEEGLVGSAEDAARVSASLGYPVVMKIESPDILHKSDAGGVVVGVSSTVDAAAAFEQIMANARAYSPNARIDGVQIQQQVPGGLEVLVGAVTDPSFGKLVAFGLGGVLVEVMRDVTFRLAPATIASARSMLDGVRGSAILDGVRGQPGVDREALAGIIESVSRMISDHPEISEIDLNPIFAGPVGATAVDARILLDFEPQPERYRPDQDEILTAMRRIMQPEAVAVIGASPEAGKIGNSVMKNLINGGYQGEIYPIHPRAPEVEGRKAYTSVTEIEGTIDVAVFCIPAPLVPRVLEEVGQKEIPGAVLIPSGFAEVGEDELQAQALEVARKHNIRLMGPNIYGFYYTHQNLCATFCTPYDERGSVALSSQSGGVGMAIIGFSRTNQMGVSAIVGLGNKADIDEDDLLTFFEQDDNTQVVAMHVEDLKDGRSFAEVASRVTKKKPVVVLKAGRTSMGARAARSHTGALAGNDQIYDDVLRECGVIRALTLNDMLEYARGLQVLPTPKGENILILTGAGGSGVLLSDACVDNGLTLMDMPDDLDAAFKAYIPPFGASGNPVDITGGEPPVTYQNTIRLALEDERVHALILGYWHTIITPPMVFAELLSEEVERARAMGIDKPVVASLVGDVEVEEASKMLMQHDILAYPYEAEKPVAVLGAKYRWARQAGLI